MICRRWRPWHSTLTSTTTVSTCSADDPARWGALLSVYCILWHARRRDNGPGGPAAGRDRPGRGSTLEDNVVEHQTSSVDAGSPFSGEIAWRPGEDALKRSRLLRLMRSNGIATLDELRRRAVADVAWFWDAVVRDLGLEFERPYEQVLDLSQGKPWARWFVGGRYNYVHNALDRHARGPLAQRPAIVWEGEDGEVRVLSFAELAEATHRLAAGLRR